MEYTSIYDVYMVIHSDCNQLFGSVSCWMLGLRGQWLMDLPICYLYDGKEGSTTATYLTTYPFNVFVSTWRR